MARVFAEDASHLIVTDIHSRTLSMLDHRATGKSFLFPLNASASSTGQVASDDPDINLPWPDPDSTTASVTNNARLLFWLRREPRLTLETPPYVCRYGGIIMNMEDEAGDAPTARYTAFDPWQYMMSRPARWPDTPYQMATTGKDLFFKPPVRASEIAAALLATTELIEGETHIDFSNDSLIEPTDLLERGMRFTEGTSVGEAWQQLCATGTIDIHLDPIYDPNFRPGKVCEFRTVRQASDVAAGPVRYDVVMAWDMPGKSLTEISRMVDGTRLANRLQYYAGEGGVPAPLESDGNSITDYGEYWAEQSFPGTHDRFQVALLAVADRLLRRRGARTVTFSPAPERTDLVLRDYALGDYVPVWASRNLREPLGIDYDAFDPLHPGASGYQRIYAIPIDLDDDGVTRVRSILTSPDTGS